MLVIDAVIDSTVDIFTSRLSYQVNLNELKLRLLIVGIRIGSRYRDDHLFIYIFSCFIVVLDSVKPSSTI